MMFFSRDSQRGFSALGIFIAGLAVIILMGSNGFFAGPKSSTGEENVTYTVADRQSSNSKGLQMTKVNFSTPTPVPPTPTPAGDVCNHDMYKKSDPDKCFCTGAWLLRCEGGQCKEINYSKSGGGGPGSMSCALINQGNPNWCQVFGHEGDGWYCIGKPVIYLYPERSMLVDVKVSPESSIFVSDPHYPTGGWKKVMAYPDGTLTYQNRQYRELFYESNTRKLNRPKAGISISKRNLEPELRAFINRLGLSREDEQQEFLDWWIPRLQQITTDKIFVSILEKDEKERLDKVSITPKPDTFIQFIAYFAPLSEGEKVQPLILPETPKRTGFTAVEWGGVIGH